MRRVPFGSEAGAFRFTLGAGLVIGVSVLIGWLSAPAVGLVVLAAAAVSAALSALCAALIDRPAGLRRAMSEAALDRARAQAGHHVLVVANEAEARTRLERSLAWAREHKIVARGEVGDPNPTTALEDALRTFGADEVIVVTHPRDRETWQERGELARLRRELNVPVTQVVVRNYRARQQTSIDPS